MCFFEAVVGQEQIRLMAEYRMKGGEDIVHTPWSLVWRHLLRAVHEDCAARRPLASSAAFDGNEIRSLGGTERQGVAVVLTSRPK